MFGVTTGKRHRYDEMLVGDGDREQPAQTRNCALLS